MVYFIVYFLVYQWYIINENMVIDYDEKLYGYFREFTYI